MTELIFSAPLRDDVPTTVVTSLILSQQRPSLIGTFPMPDDRFFEDPAWKLIIIPSSFIGWKDSQATKDITDPAVENISFMTKTAVPEDMTIMRFLNWISQYVKSPVPTYVGHVAYAGAEAIYPTLLFMQQGEIAQFPTFEAVTEQGIGGDGLEVTESRVEIVDGWPKLVYVVKKSPLLVATGVGAAETLEEITINLPRPA